MQRFVVYWEGQDLKRDRPAAVCAGHRDSVCLPLITPVVQAYCEQMKVRVMVAPASDGECALASHGGCCDDPVSVIPYIPTQTVVI